MKAKGLFAILMAVSSCTYYVDIKTDGADNHIRMVSYPGISDTTFASVSLVGSASSAPRKNQECSAEVTFTVNDKSYAMASVPGTVGRYWSTAEVKAGDCVKISAAVDGCGTVVASSSVPLDIAVFEPRIYRRPNDVTGLDVVIRDDNPGDNWYAVNVEEKRVHIIDMKASGYYKETETLSQLELEPVREERGAVSSGIFDGFMRMTVDGTEMFLFPDNLSGKLQFKFRASWDSNYYDGENITRYYYKVHVYSLSREMYDYFKAQYKMNNSDSIIYGLASASYAAGNVVGGAGVVGCCLGAESAWLPNVW